MKKMGSIFERISMKRKGIAASILAVFVSVTMIVPVFAVGPREVDRDENITGWNEENGIYCSTDCTLTIDEGGEANAAFIYSRNDLTISGGGTLNVDSSEINLQGVRAAITGADVTIQGTTVNAIGSSLNRSAGILAGVAMRPNVNGGSLTIENATVNTQGNSIGIAAYEKVTITDSTVVATGTNEEQSGGILAREGLSINNSDVIASGATAAIMSEDITLTNASVVEGSYDGNRVVIKGTGTGAILNPVPQSNDNSSSGSDGDTVFASIAQMITNAAQGATVRVTITSGTSLCKMAVDALEARPDVTLIVDYAVNGGMYEATIPAGTALAQYKNAAGGIDFDTLTANFGGKQIF